MNSAEKKILNTVKQAASLCASGSDPTQALIKCASENELNPDMCKRATESLNQALTAHHIKTAAADQKADAFPVVKIGEVLNHVFGGPGPSKKASGSVAEGDFVLTHRSAPFAAPAKKAAYISDDYLRNQVSGARDLMKRELSDLRGQAGLYRDQGSNGLIQIVDHFKSSTYNHKFASFERQVYSSYGPEAEGLLNSIAEFLPEGTPRVEAQHLKRASHSLAGKDEPAKIFDQVFDCLQKFADTQKQVAQKTAASAEFEAKALTFSLSLLPAVKPESMMGGSFKQAFDVSSLVDSELEIPSTKDIDAKGVEVGLKSQVQRPKQEADQEMDNVRREAILRDLMTNDEIISRQDPTHVGSAYNAILSLAPDLTLNSEVLRSHLRSATAAQALDPFSAQGLAGLQKSVTENKAAQNGGAIKK